MQYQKGFSLFELLLAVFVVIFGILGMSRTYLQVLHFQRQSYWLHIANQQIISLFEQQQHHINGVLPVFILQRWEAVNQLRLPGGTGQLIKSGTCQQIIVAWLDPHAIPCQLHYKSPYTCTIESMGHCDG